MNHADYKTLTLQGEWLGDIELVPAADSPGIIDSPTTAWAIVFTASTSDQRRQ